MKTAIIALVLAVVAQSSQTSTASPTILFRPSNRPRVVTPKWTAQLASRLFLERDSNPVLDHQQFHRVANGAEDIRTLLICN